MGWRMAVALVVLGVALGSCADSPADGTIVVTLADGAGNALDGEFTYQNEPDQQPSARIPASGSVEVDTAPGTYNTAAFHYTQTASTPTEAYCGGPATVAVKSGERVALNFVCSRSAP